MKSETIKIKSIEDIEKLSETYGKDAIFKSIYGDTEYVMSIAHLMFFADNTDEIDWELVLA